MKIFREYLIGLEQPTEWAAALALMPHGYWHTWAACRAASINSGWPANLYLLEAEFGRVACPLAQRNWEGFTDFTTPIGFSGFATSSGTLPLEFASHWFEFMRSRGAVCAYVAQHPAYAPSWPEGREIVASRLYLIDLRTSPRTWLGMVDANRRRSIRGWERAKSPWVLERSILQDFLVLNHASFMRSVNASTASYQTEEALHLFCSDPAVDLVGVSDREGICTVAAFGSTAWGAELLFHVSIRDGRKHTAPLIWWAVQHFHNRGIPFLNLGGSVRDNDALAAAKLRYRPEVRPFRALKQVFDTDLYVALCAKSGQSAEGLDGYFPAYRRPIDRDVGGSTHDL